MNMLKEDIQKVIKNLKETEDFYTKLIPGQDADTGTISWDVNYRPNLPALYKDISDVVAKLEKLQGKINDSDTETLLKIARSLKNRFSRVAKKHKSVNEESATAQGGASFTPGSGAQTATPRAFKGKSKSKKDKNMYHKMGWKDVPAKIKGSGLEVKKLYEGEYNEFQKGRIDIFEKIENEMNEITSQISNSRNKTIEYYSANPGSYAIVNSTDLILEYIKDIKILLKGE